MARRVRFRWRSASKHRFHFWCALAVLVTALVLAGYWNLLGACTSVNMPPY
ncbi:MAG: hypothetical protein PVI86_03285 [Phycisphaerae bacterium]